ncbi:DNA adenine methylase [Bathymodiolus thermophilus thioautotrophic gill symbiont]|uniref:Site-specific DNA-methyltransferase (adenine-specific) n=1 Tax=Bathymodiolus thermophilus thioautotrophic gill symbiont TaxID=2360 RepID=A0A1J5UM86_9GAMM|nr:DNA adenine methylase [Bathymodiolus thermophilus thioautotrophic gill symbiont]AYQ57802.1 DNA adenine methylase [Bathymodiolus thermophilus thioautotrophic gill symbiont]OIR25335.1 DNA methyltransferase [Bathymodiolus thermophilus thioautotrophic gill symbiont]
MSKSKNNPPQVAKPFLKWAGGKRGLIEQLFSKFPTEFNNYHEPFLGGGAVFFELYSRGMLKGKKAYLSDINSELINTYNVVKNNPSKLITNLQTYKENHNKEFYYQTRELDRSDNFKTLSELERATRFIYLNKTCFNGLYRVNSKGYFNTPIGSYKNPNIADKEAILNASKALQNTIIANQSFDRTIDNTSPNDFVYLDPPYYPLTETASFTAYDKNAFLDEKQKQLFDVFKELHQKKCTVMKSNSDTNFIKDLYQEYIIDFVQANRFINSKGGGRSKINEVLINNILDMKA